MNLGTMNLKLGWTVLGTVTWACLGLLVALGLSEHPGTPGHLDVELLDRPGVVTIPGNLQALHESPEGLRLVILRPPGAAGARAALPELPPRVLVEYVGEGERRHTPRIALERGRGPFRLPTGQQGVVAGGYFIRFGEDSVRIGAIPDHMRRRMDQSRERRGRRGDGPPDGPQSGPQGVHPDEHPGPPDGPPFERRRIRPPGD